MGVNQGLPHSKYATASTLPSHDPSIISTQVNRLEIDYLDHVSAIQGSETSSQSSSDISITVALNPRLKLSTKEFDSVSSSLWQCQRESKPAKNHAASNDLQRAKRHIPPPDRNKQKETTSSGTNPGFEFTDATKKSLSTFSDTIDPRQSTHPRRNTLKFSDSNSLALQKIDNIEPEKNHQQASTSSGLPFNNDTSQSKAFSHKDSESSYLNVVKVDSVEGLKTENGDKNELCSQTDPRRISHIPSLNQKVSTSQFKYSLDYDTKIPSEKLGTNSQSKLPGKAKTSNLSKKSLTIDTEFGNFHDPSIKNKDHISISSEIQNLKNFEDAVYVDDGRKEKVRALQGTDPIREHIDFAGSRIPPPCDWEGGRPRFDNSFMNSYIYEWMEDFLMDSSLQNTGFHDNEKWQSQDFHVDGLTLLPPYEHEDIYPTPGETCELESKRKHQTVYAVIRNEYNKFQQKLAKQRRSEKKYQNFSYEAVHSTYEVNPFSPKISMYLRPAEAKDSEQVAQIYNKHVAEGNITEDQESISTADALHLIDNNRKEKLPFIVAVAGKIPPSYQARHQSQSACRTEKIIGFAFNERYNYGFSGSVKGRSRYTTMLQLFVAHDYQRKGVGRNLLDRLIHMLSTAYGYKKACDFINPSNDKVHECEGSGLWHQIQFHVPVLKEDDPDFPGINKFLYSQFLVKELYRMKSTGRTNISRGPAKWLDTAIFQFETSQEGNFDPYC
ncbi:hypothetical protein K3495_g6034 [Podosphaera aphanis]|nr:hypothetical protein K3495_g6034 [Podosphaera aphanis]